MSFVTGSVPGSYLGMDPAFLVWIPPLEEGDILKEIDENKVPIYEVGTKNVSFSDIITFTESTSKKVERMGGYLFPAIRQYRLKKNFKAHKIMYSFF